VAGYRKGSLAAARVSGPHLDLARGIRLNPDGGIALADVSEEGSEKEAGHA
jgi:hypothetical protein